MIFWKRKKPEQTSATDALIGTLPDDVATVYAIGDVHGMIELARHAEAEIAAQPDFEPNTSVILYLGDLVDRGPDTAFLLDWVIAKSKTGARRMFLRGNHEQMFQAFLSEPAQHMNWLDFGGYETLNSYGIMQSLKKLQAMRSRDLRTLLETTISETHRRFLSNMYDAIDAPGFFFAHAGVDPERPLLQQTRQDLLWSRHRFMGHEGGFEKTIVHGHTPVPDPIHEAGRVSIDTGAYSTGKLTVAKLSLAAASVEFIVVTGHGD